ncbi:MAG: hypothetical protein E7220_00210 [Clostridiales bacterium]|nr:hypothetical protein [Clostridiales bacterium]
MLSFWSEASAGDDEEDDGDGTTVYCDVTVIGESDPDVESVTYVQSSNVTARYDLDEQGFRYTGDDDEEYKPFAGDQIIIAYKESDEHPDGGQETYTCEFNEDEERYCFIYEYTNTYEEDGEEYEESDYRTIYPSFVDDQSEDNRWEPNTEYNVDIYVKGHKAANGVNVKTEDIAFAKSLEYSGKEFTVREGDELNWLEAYDEVGNVFSVVYTDGSRENYKSVSYKYDGDTQVGYFLNGKVTYDSEEGYPEDVWFERTYYDEEGNELDEDSTIEGDKSYFVVFTYHEALGGPVSTDKIPLKVKMSPTKAVFTTADGKPLEGYLGQTEAAYQSVCKVGNKIDVYYSDGSLYGTYKCVEIEDGWNAFHLDGNKKKEEIWPNFSGKPLVKGDNTLNLTVYVEEDDYGYEVKGTVDVVASRYDVVLKLKPTTSVYTGKVIKPKCTVYIWDGKKTGAVVPASEYKIMMPKAKAIGWYGVSAVMKDTTKYADEAWSDFCIIPKAATIKKVTSPKKKQMKVTWKKATSKEKKTIDGFIIQYSTSKKFNKGVKTVKVGKKASSKVIKKLKSKKTYYVRVYTYKNVKYTGQIWSKPSKVKKIKIK